MSKIFNELSPIGADSEKIIVFTTVNYSSNVLFELHLR
jgi:hypothetical protein